MKMEFAKEQSSNRDWMKFYDRLCQLDIDPLFSQCKLLAKETTDKRSAYPHNKQSASFKS